MGWYSIIFSSLFGLFSFLFCYLFIYFPTFQEFRSPLSCNCAKNKSLLDGEVVHSQGVQDTPSAEEMVASDGPAKQALFMNPSCVQVGPTGDLFAVDRGNHCIRRIQAPQNGQQPFCDNASVRNSGSTVAHVGHVGPRPMTQVAGGWPLGPQKAQTQCILVKKPKNNPTGPLLEGVPKPRTSLSCRINQSVTRVGHTLSSCIMRTPPPYILGLVWTPPNQLFLDAVFCLFEVFFCLFKF